MMKLKKKKSSLGVRGAPISTAGAGMLSDSDSESDLDLDPGPGPGPGHGHQPSSRKRPRLADAGQIPGITGSSIGASSGPSGSGAKNDRASGGSTGSIPPPGSDSEPGYGSEDAPLAQLLGRDRNRARFNGLATKPDPRDGQLGIGSRLRAPGLPMSVSLGASGRAHALLAAGGVTSGGQGRRAGAGGWSSSRDRWLGAPSSGRPRVLPSVLAGHGVAMQRIERARQSAATRRAASEASRRLDAGDKSRSSGIRGGDAAGDDSHRAGVGRNGGSHGQGQKEWDRAGEGGGEREAPFISDGASAALFKALGHRT